jgi:ribosomal protein S27E
VRREFEDYLKCGRLEHGFLRVRCTGCHSEKLVAFSCKRRGFCPSCGARRMVESAALLVDEVLPAVPMRQWVLSVPFALRFLFASNAAAMGEALRIVYRTISGFLIRRAGLARGTGQCGAVTLIQRFGSALKGQCGANARCEDLGGQRLKRVFGIEIESCQHCGGAVKIIASIEEPQVIGRILEHLGLDGSDAHGRQLPPARAPPIRSIGLFD